MTGSRTALVRLPTDTQILITREFDAPRQLALRDDRERPDRSQQERDMHIDSGMEGGMHEAMDHLEQVARSLR